MTTSWSFDPLQSFVHGLELQCLRPRTESQVPLGRGAVSAPAPLAWAETVFVSICHSTNWDYLHDSIMKTADEDPGFIAPEALARMTLDDFTRLTSLHSNPIDDRRKRLAIIRSLGREAVEQNFYAFLEACAGGSVPLDGHGGVYKALSSLTVFAEDPLSKKMRVLVHQWSNRGVFRYADPMKLAPAVDYHLIRLYMRTNRIFPKKRETLNRFLDGRRIGERELFNIRRAVETAMYYTADGAGLPMDQLNHFEWQIARSFCIRAEPRCEGQPLPEKPVEFELRRLAERLGGCPFSGICRGKVDGLMRRVREPLSVTNYY